MEPSTLILLIQLTALNDKHLDVNAYAIVSLQDVTDGVLVGEGAKCGVSTVDGRSILVKETCDRVRVLMLEGLQ